jgi:hypothetical protein
LHGLAALAGLAAARLGLPLPWMIGPMVLAAIVNLWRTRVEVPPFTRPVGQLIVAAVVGASFTPTALRAAMDHFVAMLVVSAALPVLAVAAGLLLRKMTRIDVMTASLASIPGGPAEMSALAVRYGADPAVVALVQTIRIFVLVLTLPALVVAVDGSVHDPAALHDWGAGGTAGALLLLAIALAGGIAFHVCRLTSPFFLGALAFTATASVLDAPIAMPPAVVLAGAQVLLGVWLGTMFDRALILEGRRFVVAALVSTVVLMALAIALALVVTASAGIHWETMVLSTAPGGVTEMALTARLLHQDVATVTAFQVARIFTTLALAPLLLSLSLWLVRAGRRRRRDRDDGAP